MKRVAFTLAGLLISLSLSAQTLNAPHDASNKMACNTCHKVHTSPNAAIGTSEGNLNLCRSCHNPVGATDAEVHSHKDMSFETCTTCHGVHEQEQTANGSTFGKYVKTSIQTPNSGLKTVIFKGATGQKSYADGDSTYDGICEVCHTKTAHHRNNSSGDHSHYKGQNCTDCHTHSSGFGMKSGTVNCLDCHNAALGPGGYRRQSVGGTSGTVDFSMKSHHSYKGTTQSVAQADCEVCHDQSSHRTLTDGVTTLLKNADTGAPITFNGTNTSMEAFCVSCHDSNGANGNLKPFSDGQATRDIVFGSAYNNSVHKQNNVGCYGDGTNGCHANGHGSLKRAMLAPYNVAANTSNYSEQDEGFCIKCHPAISTAMGRGFNHMMTSTTTANKHMPNEPLIKTCYSGARRHAECVDCHSQHWAKAGTHTAGTNVLSNSLLYVQRIRATYGTTAWVNPVFGAVSSKDSSLGYEYEICFKCHSAWAYGTTMPKTSQNITETDQSKEFNPNNLSYHPVVRAIGTNSYTQPTTTNGNIQTMNAPWNTGKHSTMYCSDCHRSSVATDPKGPHGSLQSFGLVAEPTQALCLVCHKSSTYLSTNGKQGSRYSHTRGDHKRYPCRACHGGPTGSIHGTNAAAGFMNGTHMRTYTRPPAAGGRASCSTVSGCHEDGESESSTLGPE